MNKAMVFILLLLLCGCVEAGEFTPKRHKMHDLNRTDTCEQDSRKCISGTNIPW